MALRFLEGYRKGRKFDTVVSGAFSCPSEEEGSPHMLTLGTVPLVSEGVRSVLVNVFNGETLVAQGEAPHCR